MAFSRQLLKRRAAYAALFAAGAAFLQLGAVSGAPWNLTSYEFCRHVPLSGVPAEASGITYSPVTNSLYVITRNPRAVVEFNLEGKRLRSIPYDDLSDPEGKLRAFHRFTIFVAKSGWIFAVYGYFFNDNMSVAHYVSELCGRIGRA